MHLPGEVCPAVFFTTDCSDTAGAGQKSAEAIVGGATSRYLREQVSKSEDSHPPKG